MSYMEMQEMSQSQRSEPSVPATGWRYDICQLSICIARDGRADIRISASPAPGVSGSDKVSSIQVLSDILSQALGQVRKSL